MKIGILNFHRALNYGAVLQCYGLQETLTALGHEVSVIDYNEEMQKNIRTVYVMPEFSDFKVALRLYNKNIFSWFNDVCRTNRFMEYDSRDKKPFWVGLYHELYDMLYYKLLKNKR